MICPQCQVSNRDGARFCRGCGARLPAPCPACGAPLEPDSRFCSTCGTAVGAASAAPAGASVGAPTPVAAGVAAAGPESLRPAAPAGFPSAAEYTPKHLAERILASRHTLEGERKVVTVLFTDLKGSTELVSTMDPEEARNFLDPVLQLMMDAVHQYEGTVTRVMGDGIMALFGAPIAHEDHALRACQASLRMQELVQRHAEEVKRTKGWPVAIRVGLNTGDVVVRSIGSDLHMDYTAQGMTTHLAARMEQTANPGMIQLTAETRRLVEGYVETASRGPVEVKGLAHPIEVWEVTGMGQARRRLQVSAARGFSPFVGREREWAVLESALAAAREGRGRVVAFAGEAGVGKSRLFWELVRSERTRGWRVLEASSVSYGKATPFLPVIDLLRAHFALDAAQGPAEVAAQVAGRLAALDPALVELLPPLLALLDVPVDDAAWATLGAPRQRQRMLDAVQRLILRESQAQPVAVIFEDLHWIDTETQALLDALVPRLGDARVLLLVNYRPEYRLPWTALRWCAELRVNPLAAEGAEALLAHLLGAAPELEPLVRLLHERTGGNPFFVEESVRTLVEEDALAGAAGAYRLARPLATIRIPGTVQGILAARIDRLEPSEKWLLQTASVIGKDVPMALLDSIAEVTAEPLAARLERLRDAEFLYAQAAPADAGYTFKHALTLEVAYSSLLRDQRRELHGRTLQAMEGLYSERRSDEIAKLALHAFRGEVWDRAVTYSRQAGLKAAGRSANREAIGYLQQALEATGHLPAGPAPTTLSVDLRLDLRGALLALGEFARVLEVLAEARAGAEALGDRRRAGAVESFTSQSLSWAGDHVGAIAAGRRAMDAGRSLGDLPLEVVATYRLAQFHLTVGDLAAGAELARAAAAALDGPRERERFGLAGLPAVLARMVLVWCLAELGEFAGAAAPAAHALALAEAVDHTFDRVNASFAAGLVWVRQGELARAITVLERGVRLARAAELPGLFPSVGMSLGAAYALAGRTADALPLLDEAVAGHRALGVVGSRSLFLAAQGDGYLCAGQLDRAAEAAAEALDFSRRFGERLYEGWTLRLLGEIAARQTPADVAAAERHYRAALELGSGLGMRPLVARCDLGLGELYQAEGDRPRARAALADAIAGFTAMEMSHWLARALEHVASLR